MYPQSNELQTGLRHGETLRDLRKGPVVGRNISHAHNVTARRFEPNLQRVRAVVNGGIRRLRVCTRCLRSNKVVKAA
jgi:large subunit ribosomal protein L28